MKIIQAPPSLLRLRQVMKGDWFEYRSKCVKCGWDGPDDAIMQLKRLAFTAEFPVCPGCGEWKERNPIVPGGHRSTMTGYAVHRACGRWHPEGTPCAGKAED